MRHLKRAQVLGAAALLLLASGCGTIGPGEVGSGDLVTLTPDVAEFSRIDAASAFAVDVTVGEEYGVTVRADDNLIDQVEAGVSGDTLRLRLDGSATNPTLEADVVVPAEALRGVAAAGAATILGGDPLAAEDFSVDVAGASTVRLDLAADRLEIDATGASTVGLLGSAGALTARASGASTLQLFELLAEDADVTADGASTIEVAATGSLEAEANGASTIRYDGSPAQVRESSSGASDIGPR